MFLHRLSFPGWVPGDYKSREALIGTTVKSVVAEPGVTYQQRPQQDTAGKGLIL
jgi:hypothetical protein